jgi:hypothetical protein
MSNAIAQSATERTFVAQSPENFDFAASVLRAANRQEKNNMKEKLTLNRSKLISSVCADFRDHNSSLFAKRNEAGEVVTPSLRLPPEHYSKVEKAVDDFITVQFNRVNHMNVISFVRRHIHVPAKQMFVERVINTGENSIGWKEQLCACHIQQGVVHRRMEDADKGNRLTNELQQQLQKQLNSLAVTEENIRSNMRELANAAAPAK